MIAEVPNHPSGIIPPTYRGKLYERVDLDGIDVIRVWVKASPVKTFRSRMAFYLSYTLMAILAGLLLARGKYQVVYATSPPLFVGAAALILTYWRRIPFVFEVRDLWPESAIALGELQNPHAIRWATQLEEACYHRAKKIVVTTQEMVDYLMERGFSADKLALIRNGANSDLFQFDPVARQTIRRELQVQDKFVVVYAGLLGLAQGIESCLEAASLLNQETSNVHLLFIGEGPLKEILLEKAKTLNLTNITFLAAQPREKIPGYLSAADAALVPLTSKRLLGALPSKMFDAMACQRPILLSAAGEACHVLAQAEAGLIIPPENVSALVQGIKQLNNDFALCQKLGKNGRKAVVAHYSRQALAQQLVTILEQTTAL
jgi:glycosyltransferase involved in cell wall biosynthesis